VSYYSYTDRGSIVKTKHKHRKEETKSKRPISKRIRNGRQTISIKPIKMKERNQNNRIKRQPQQSKDSKHRTDEYGTRVEHIRMGTEWIHRRKTAETFQPALPPTLPSPETNNLFTSVTKSHSRCAAAVSVTGSDTLRRVHNGSLNVCSV